MQLSFLSLVFAIVFVMAIIYAPGTEAEAISNPDAMGGAEPFLIDTLTKLFGKKK
ncbi:PREDICTED: pilosulin-4-like [Vollenhovia emeryi]|uniref:pilosulin-4-like n=1 Tax=Vollenhovia emeryi TaxID=411798 RepID=UPI0005F4D544|nr:PREDICTED: pilosulin-4-like [Vollenhovia emeryi]